MSPYVIQERVEGGNRVINIVEKVYEYGTYGYGFVMGFTFDAKTNRLISYEEPYSIPGLLPLYQEFKFVKRLNIADYL